MLDSYGLYTSMAQVSEFAGIFMASCDNELDRCAAQMYGFKTFQYFPRSRRLHVMPNNVQLLFSIALPMSNGSADCDGAKQDIFVTAHVAVQSM